MRYRRLGSSDLEVSEISLGSWLTFAGGVGFEQTRACTDAAFLMRVAAGRSGPMAIIVASRILSVAAAAAASEANGSKES